MKPFITGKWLICLISSPGLLLMSQTLIAQQLPQYSQYTMNKFLMNPGITGGQNYIDLKAGYRNQWVNFEDRPVTYYISGHAPVGKQNIPEGRRSYGSYNENQGFHGVGGYIINDVTGPTQRFWAYGSYAYHLPLGSGIKVSMGAFAGIKRFSIDGTQLTTFEGGDPLTGRRISKSMPDASVGIWTYSDQFYAGFSGQQLFGNKVGFQEFSDLKGEKGHLRRHWFLTGGYNFNITREVSVVPSAMLKYEAAAPLSVDVSARLRYKDVWWAGLNYRHEDAFSMFTGLLFQDRYSIGYAFDLTTSDIFMYSAGTHELVVGLRLNLPDEKLGTSYFW